MSNRPVGETGDGALGYHRRMDILSDVLLRSGLKKHLLRHRAIHEPWAMRCPCDRSIGFHVVTQGEAYVRFPHLSDTVRLRRGDIILLARGFAHEIATDPSVPVRPETASAPREGSPLLTLVSGLYQFVNEPIHPFFREIPDHVVVRAETVAAHDPVHTALQLLSAEAARSDLGSETVTRALLDILFTYIMRQVVQQKAQAAQSWCHAVSDPHLAKVLQAMHTDWARDWGLEELARHGGMSRASLALKFKQAMGETPLRYLTTLRMQHAMELLAGSDRSIEQIAHAVGYGDAFGFSKTFKKVTGAPPREFRRRTLAESRQSAR